MMRCIIQHIVRCVTHLCVACAPVRRNCTAGTGTAIEDDELCTSLMAELEQLAGRHGARVLVPDAHVSLGVRRNRDVMIAHLKLWQHFSVNDPDLGRFGTPVHIA